MSFKIRCKVTKSKSNQSNKSLRRKKSIFVYIHKTITITFKYICLFMIFYKIENNIHRFKICIKSILKIYLSRFLSIEFVLRATTLSNELNLLQSQGGYCT